MSIRYPLTDAEIEPGLVIFMDQPMLRSDPEARFTGSLKDASPRPMVCIARRGDMSVWAPLTTRARPERLWLRTAWRIGGTAQWRHSENYLNDGANLYAGTNAAFIRASHAEVCDLDRRARLLPDGLAAVLAEVDAQVHRRTRAWRSFDHTLTNNDPPTDAGRDACAGVGAGGAE